MRKLWRFPQRLRPQGFPGFENFHTASTASIGDHGSQGTSTAFHTTVRKIVENSVEVVEAEFHAMHACHARMSWRGLQTASVALAYAGTLAV